MGRGFYLTGVTIVCLIRCGKSVPIDYCLQPLDTGDCKGKPTPVFTYYKPGSRCEVDVWRGCPTVNKFDDEVLCSHHCIGKIIDEVNEIDGTILDTINCEEPINQNDCGVNKLIFKYTFTDNMCVKVRWRGCDSPNMFSDEKTCKKTCMTWQEKMENLPMVHVNAISQILDNIDDKTTEDNEIDESIQEIESQEEQHIHDHEIQQMKVKAKTVVSEAPEETTEDSEKFTTIVDEITTETHAEVTTEAVTEETEAVTEETEAVTEETEVVTEEVTTSITELVTTEPPTPDATTTIATTTVNDESGSAEEVITT